MDSTNNTTSDENQQYFKSYDNPEVHKVMLNDKVRVESYKNAIFQNKNYIRGKTVLDVGAGTGILSVFCAQAGAAKVYAVEASEMAEVLKGVVAENKFTNVIEVIKGDIEKIELPCKVDIIVSEWMGHYLFHEAMLHSVLYARDKFLKEGGEMFPEYCTIYAAPCVLFRLYDRWCKVSGVKMKSFGKALRESYSNSPIISNIKFVDLISNDGCEILEFNMKELQIKDADVFSGRMFCVCSRVGRCHGICIWFTVEFPILVDGVEDAVILSTRPSPSLTHWKQSILVLPEEIDFDIFEPIVGNLVFQRNGTSRQYNVTFTQLNPEEEKHPVPCECFYAKCKVIKAMMDKQKVEEGSSEEESEGSKGEDGEESEGSRGEESEESDGSKVDGDESAGSKGEDGEECKEDETNEDLYEEECEEMSVEGSVEKWWEQESTEEENEASSEEENDGDKNQKSTEEETAEVKNKKRPNEEETAEVKKKKNSEGETTEDQNNKRK